MRETTPSSHLQQHGQLSSGGGGGGGMWVATSLWNGYRPQKGISSVGQHRQSQYHAL